MPCTTRRARNAADLNADVGLDPPAEPPGSEGDRSDRSADAARDGGGDRCTDRLDRLVDGQRRHEEERREPAPDGAFDDGAFDHADEVRAWARVARGAAERALREGFDGPSGAIGCQRRVATG